MHIMRIFVSDKIPVTCNTLKEILQNLKLPLLEITNELKSRKKSMDLT